MLAIRMQRTGRKGHAMFRVVVQDARRTPTSGKIVAQLGSYDPHSKSLTLDKEKAGFYLEHGAQPSGRVTLLLKQEGVKLPNWVSLPGKKEQTVRNPAKRRSTRSEEPVDEAKPAKEPEAAEIDEAEISVEDPAENTLAAEESQAKTEIQAEPEAEAKTEEPPANDAKPNDA